MDPSLICVNPQMSVTPTQPPVGWDHQRVHYCFPLRTHLLYSSDNRWPRSLQWCPLPIWQRYSSKIPSYATFNFTLLNLSIKCLVQLCRHIASYLTVEMSWFCRIFLEKLIGREKQSKITWANSSKYTSLL